MRLFKDNAEFQGTPEEIADFLSLTQKTFVEDDGNIPYAGVDFSGLENVVSESEQLRAKLAKNPAYNPFPGISKSPESEDVSGGTVPKSELDTGVNFSD